LLSEQLPDKGYSVKKEYVENAIRTMGTPQDFENENSDTNATNELLKAARLSESTCKGLNIWDILKIIKNGFKASFTDHETKRKLIEDAEQNIKNFLKNYIDGFL
ncbi:MAG TPA: hypothetical protein PLX16_05600, partial [Exilispira sp.]|nr:hypothetical protein [Exilispira sp.]